jgi:hypothetical protein
MSQENTTYLQKAATNLGRLCMRPKACLASRPIRGTHHHLVAVPPSKDGYDQDKRASGLGGLGGTRTLGRDLVDVHELKPCGQKPLFDDLGKALEKFIAKIVVFFRFLAQAFSI